MSPSLTHTLITAALLAVGALPALAQSASISVPVPTPAGTGPAPSVSAFDRFANQAKKPVDWFSWGADFRIRNEYGDNFITLSDADPLHEQDVLRMRSRIWGSIVPAKDLSLNVRLSNEAREWFRPSFAGQYRGEEGMEWRYGIVDNLNVKWANAFGLPMTITGGRQDIMLGDTWNWWLMTDGTPGDGSWTFFFDAVRVTYDAADIKTKLDVIYLYQNALPDEWIPTIDRSGNFNPPYTATEQTEQGVVVYLSNKSIENMQIDPYFIYKRDNRETGLSNGDDAEIYTVGAKITGTPADHWQYSIEGAYQFGEKTDPTLKYSPVTLDSSGSSYTPERDIDAFGANARLTYLCKDTLNNQLHVVYEYLSGDDPDTGDDEMFDILWGRWPRMSELYLYSYIYETGGKVAQWNNLHRIGCGWTMVPMKGMHLGFYYNALFAPQEVPTRALRPALFSRDGDFRGHYLQAVLKHQFNKHIAGHVWGECIWEGDYYAQRELMTFLRAELLFTF